MNQEIKTLFESVVVPDTSASRRLSVRRMLEDCWVPLRDAIEPKLADVLLEALGPIARSNNADEAALARRVLANDRKFVQSFSDALHKAFKDAVKDFIDHKAVITERSKGSKGWSLVEFGEMELSTAVETGSKRISHAIEDSYSAAKQRLANLVKEPDLKDGENPFRPAIVLRAVHAALVALEVKEDQLYAMLQRFEPAFVTPMTLASQAIDRHFAAKGISSDSELPSMGRSIAGRHFASGISPDMLLQTMYQRLQMPTRSGAHASPAIGGHYIPTPTLGGSLTSSSKTGGSLGLVDTGLLSAISEIQKLGALALIAAQKGGALEQKPEDDPTKLRQSLLEKAPRQVDKLTIEIVGLLFDRVNRDRFVPQEIKDLIQRLQFPIIRVALTDPDLFALNDHPARQLMDRIATTAVGWTSEGAENQRYLEKVRQTVCSVLEERSDTPNVFEKALSAFETYLTEEQTRDDDPVMRAKRALLEAENREIMVINATIKIRSAFEGVQLESYLRDFLLTVWPRVLVAVALREKHSEQKRAGVKTYLSIVPDLVWSVQPKLHQDDRKRLVGTIPPVLNILRKGLTLIDWPKDQMQRFFAQLMNSHAQAVKALELAQESATPAFEASTMRIKLDGIEIGTDGLIDEVDASAVHVPDEVVEQALAENQAEVKHIAAPIETEAASDIYLDEVSANRILELMRRGQWYSLQQGDHREPIQLRWVSPYKTLYLFTAGDKKTAHSLSPEAITGLLLSGRLRVLEAEPLFERVVKDVLSDLRSASQDPEPSGSLSV